MDDPNQKIGALIYKVRQMRGLTQADFAKRLGTSQSAVNRIEHGKQNLSLKTLQRISDVLNYQVISLNEPGKPRVEVFEDPETGKLTITVERS